LAHPSPSTLTAHGQGAHTFLGLNPSMPVVASNRDPTIYEYGAKPTTDAHVYATIHSGGTTVRA
jgi:hypothetical protein